jgi:hypothetical protein
MSMAESELRKVIAWLDASLEVFRANEGRLTAAEIRLRSLIAVLHAEAGEQLERMATLRAKK